MKMKQPNKLPEPMSGLAPGHGSSQSLGKDMRIDYSHDRRVTLDQFIDVLKRSTLAERRPIGDRARISRMLEHGNLTCTAWASGVLVGISRSVTDFAFCCYLSDLAVDVAHQRSGIGKRLIELTRERLHPECKLILLAAPEAEGYYPKIGFSHFHSAWILPQHRDKKEE